jgi:N-acyl homoserine lactone hydrolase
LTNQVRITRRLFRSNIHFVQRRELEYALVPDWFAADAFAKSDVGVPGLAWHLLEGSETDAYDLFGDGTVRIILTPGHSVGHQSFLVTLPKTGAVLLTIDAAYTMEHWEEKTLPSFATGAVEAVRSVKKHRQIARSTNALVVTGHDPIVYGPPSDMRRPTLINVWHLAAGVVLVLVVVLVLDSVR